MRDAGITRVCRTFGVAETCHRYERKLDDENAVIADWLIRPTANRRDWGFGSCFPYLRNVEGFGWNRRRVCRISRAPDLIFGSSPDGGSNGTGPNRSPPPRGLIKPGRWISCRISWRVAEVSMR